MDATALDSSLLEVQFAFLNTAAAKTVNLLPGTNVLYSYALDLQFDITVAADGTISYDPSLQGILTGAGTNTLVINP